MRQIVVTGATSFIGVPLTKALLAKGYGVVAVVRNASSKRKQLPDHANLRIVELEMCRYHELHRYIDSCDVLIGLAWNGTRGSNRENCVLQRENYDFSMDALRSVKKLGCQTVIQAGSQAEYGSYNCRITEQTPSVPLSEYGKYKLKLYQDALVFCKESGMTLKEPRFFSLYGENDFEGTLVNLTLHKMLKDADCSLTLCEQMWDFMYIDDAVESVIRLIEVDCADGIYNIASGDSRPLREFVEVMRRVTNSQSKLHFGAVPYASAGKLNLMPDITKLKSETGFSPATAFENGIKKIYESIKGE